MVNAYLNFGGNALEAVNFYADAFHMFWTKCYGYVVDKFGVGWQLSLEA